MSTFNLDQDTLLNAIDDDVVAVLAINILGNPCPLSDLKVVCDDSNVFLLEDNCESLGAEIDTASGPKKAGSFGLMSTHSFFFSHHINTMEADVCLPHLRNFLCF